MNKSQVFRTNLKKPWITLRNFGTLWVSFECILLCSLQSIMYQFIDAQIYVYSMEFSNSSKSFNFRIFFCNWLSSVKHRSWFIFHVGSKCPCYDSIIIASLRPKKASSSVIGNKIKIILFKQPLCPKLVPPHAPLTLDYIVVSFRSCWRRRRTMIWILSKMVTLRLNWLLQIGHLFNNISLFLFIPCKPSRIHLKWHHPSALAVCLYGHN